MKRFFAVAIVVICVSGTISAADRQLLGLMMPDAKVLAVLPANRLRCAGNRICGDMSAVYARPLAHP